jgi:hypothetical protein
MSPATWIKLGAVAAVAVVGVILYRKFSKVADKAVDAVSSGIAAPIIAIDEALGDGPVTVAGRAVLPNGQRVPLSQINLNPDATFSYGGVRYKLTGRRPDNDYDAVRQP